MPSEKFNLLDMFCVDVSSDTSTDVGTGVGADVGVEEEKDVTQELVSRPTDSNVTSTPAGASQGPSHGVRVASSSPAPTKFRDADIGKTYDMLKAGQEQRWKDVRAFVEAGKDIHTGTTSGCVCSLLK